MAQISFKTGVQYDKIMSQMRALIPHILQFISHHSETKTNVGTLGTSLRQIWLSLERSAIKKMGDTEQQCQIRTMKPGVRFWNLSGISEMSS